MIKRFSWLVPRFDRPLRTSAAAPDRWVTAMVLPAPRRTLALVATLALMLGACASEPPRQYVDPTGPDADVCLRECQAQRFACRTPIQRRDEDCQYRYRIAYSQFQRCLQIRGNRGGCQKPQNCRVPNYQGCGREYDACFLGCGGQIKGGDEDYRVD